MSIVCKQLSVILSRSYADIHFFKALLVGQQEGHLAFESLLHTQEKVCLWETQPRVTGIVKITEKLF